MLEKMHNEWARTQCASSIINFPITFYSVPIYYSISSPAQFHSPTKRMSRIGRRRCRSCTTSGVSSRNVIHRKYCAHTSPTLLSAGKRVANYSVSLSPTFNSSSVFNHMLDTVSSRNFVRPESLDRSPCCLLMSVGSCRMSSPGRRGWLLRIMTISGSTAPGKIIFFSAARRSKCVSSGNDPIFV